MDAQNWYWRKVNFYVHDFHYNCFICFCFIAQGIVKNLIGNVLSYHFDNKI